MQVMQDGLEIKTQLSAGQKEFTGILKLPSNLKASLRAVGMGRIR